MKSAFAQIQTTSDEAAIKLDLVDELARFVESRFARLGQPLAAVRWAPVVNCIKAELSAFAIKGRKGSTPKDGLRQLVIEHYFAEYETNCRTFLHEIVHPVAVTHWAEEAAHIVAHYGSERRPPAESPTVAGALEMAWANLRTAQQRWAVWLCLGAMLHRTAAGRERDSAELQDYSAISSVLKADVKDMSRRVMAFAILDGGESLDQVRHWMHKTMLSGSMSVMEYLSYDNGLPHSWRAEDEKGFRASIAVACSEQRDLT